MDKQTDSYLFPQTLFAEGINSDLRVYPSKSLPPLLALTPSQDLRDRSIKYIIFSKYSPMSAFSKVDIAANKPYLNTQNDA